MPSCYEPHFAMELGNFAELGNTLPFLAFINSIYGAEAALANPQGAGTAFRYRGEYYLLEAGEPFPNPDYPNDGSAFDLAEFGGVRYLFRRL